MGSTASLYMRFSLSTVSVFSTTDVDSKRLVSTFEDPEWATVGSLKRPLVAVATDEDIIGRFEVVRNVFRLLTVSRCWDRTEALNVFAEASEKMRRVGVCRRGDKVAWDG